jgi:TP901 family phage tail tape measure protein
VAGRNIKGITVEIGGDTTGLSKALQSVNKEIKDTQSQLKDVEKLLKMDPGNTDLLAQRQRLLTDAVSETKEKLETLKTAAEQASQALANGDISQDQYDALQREIAETEQALKNLENQAEQSATAMQKIAATGEKLQETGDKISGVGEKLMPVTAAVTGLGTVAVKTAADFDTAMSKVAAVSGATGDDLDALREKAREMGAKTKFSASEAAEAMNYMAMAGWKTSDMLSGIEGIMNLAAASGEDLATTSDIVTDALSAFGLTAADSGHFADVLAAASSNANTNVSMMGETFKYCAPVAGALGYSIDDVAQAIGLMANSGIKSSQAGTALRTILTKLQGDLTLTGSALGEVTIQTSNADGSMRELSDILADCRSAFSQMTESEAAAAAETLVGKNAMSGFLALMNAAPADIEKLSGAIAGCGGTAEDMANTMQDNLGGQLTILKSQLEELAISFGEMLMPVIRDIVSHIQKFVDKLNNMDEGTRKVILTIAAVVAALGPVLIIIGKVISSVGTILTIIPKIGPALTAVKGAFAGLNAVMAANPIILIIAAIAALVAAFIYLWNNCEGFRQFWIDLWEGIKSVVSTCVEAIKNFFSGVIDFVKNNWQGLLLLLVNPFAGAFKLLYDNCEGFRQFIDNLWVNIKTGIETAWTAISEFFVNTWTSITETATAAWTAISDFFTLLWSTITEAVTTVWTNISLFFTNTWIAITEGISIAWTAIKDFFVNIWTAISTFISTTANNIWNTLTTIWNNILSTISGIVNTLATTISTVFTNIWNGIKNTVTGIFNTVRDGFNQAVNFIKGLASEAFNWGADIIRNIINGIKSMISGVVNAVSSVASTIRSYLHFSVPDVGPLTDFEDWMPDFMSGLAKGIEGSRKLIEKAVSGVAADMVISPKAGQLQFEGASAKGGSSVVQHTGTIRVEGVNDDNTLTDVVDIVIDKLRQEVRL